MTSATAASGCTRIGVGFDTARYAHHVTFLCADLQPAGKPFYFPETAEGYQKLQQAFQQLAQRHPEAHFHIRIDAAGQYAANLESFLRRLLAGRLCDVLGCHPRLKVHILVTDFKPNDRGEEHWHLVLRPQVVEALLELGCFSPRPVPDTFDPRTITEEAPA